VEKEAFELAWQPTLADLEGADRAKRRATRVVWLDRGVGALLALGSIPALIHGDPVAIFFFVFGISLAADLYGRAYKRLFFYRRHPHIFEPTQITLTAAGIDETDGRSAVHSDWGRWRAVLHQDDRLILMTATGGNCGLFPLPKRALLDQEQWDALVRLVESRVPDHPRDPSPRAMAT